LALCVLTLALATTAAGCGSESDSGGTSSSAATAAAAPSTAAASTTAAKQMPTGEPVTIGLIAPTDSQVISFPGIVAADRAAVRTLNTNGGLAGHPVKLLYCNDQSDPNETAKCARKMVDAKVAFMAGTSLVAPTISFPILEKAGIPEIGGNATSAPEYNSPLSYLFNGGAVFGYRTMAAWAAHNDIPTSLVSVDVASATQLRPVLEDTIKQAGSSFTSTVLVSPTQTDFSAPVAASQAKGGKAAMMFMGSGQVVQFMSTAEKQAPDLKFFSPQPLDPKAIESVGTAYDNLIEGLPYPPFTIDNPVMKEFRDSLAAEEASGDKDATVGAMDENSFGSWLGIYAINEIVKQTNMTDITSANIVKALDATKDLDLGGVIPPWTPTKEGPEGFKRVSNPTTYLIGIKDGKQYLITKEPVSVDDAIAGNFG
jgi:ABC-type branched-subunit amino acid transport system substrate-binding protein